MKKVWQILWKLRLQRLADAIAMAHAAPYAWKMVYGLAHPGQTQCRTTSFINGWRAQRVWGRGVGWVSEIEPYVGQPMTCDPKPVETTYACGHVYKSVTPGVCDPAGMLYDLPMCSDGVIRTNDIVQNCYNCRTK